MRRIVFPDWSRLALGVGIGVVSFLIAGDVFSLGETERAALSSIFVLLGAAGIVPPAAGDLRLSSGVSLLLSIGVVVLTYLLNTVIDPDVDWLRGLLIAVLAFGASVGIGPPQAVPRL